MALPGKINSTDYTMKYKENSGNKEGYGQRCRVPEDSRTSVQHTT